VLPAGDQDEVDLLIISISSTCFGRKFRPPAPEDGRNYRSKHVELVGIINKIIIVAPSWLFILLYQ
jgi:hypothetical protein